ncbi:amino acid adenylation domain-containing protein [Rhizobium rhizogenes]|uniref:amino acid adenylation domain-containing protein n=1 Tax=Rhizobium rhizogenes TaxID=359 RepID=UPI001295D189|nr:amino acid adenylation domain-containing protein [Rhizobium rhizogenes]MQB34200.1 amino acid adenylation domain-containing protein [Rhizobium rhizogenes]
MMVNSSNNVAKDDYILTVAKTRPAGALCHAFRVGIAEVHDISRLIASFDERIACLGFRSSLVELWQENVPVRSDSDQAARRRRREINRAIVSSHLALRVVVLNFTNKAADLILVAKRLFIDSVSLRDFARTLIHGGEVIANWPGVEWKLPHGVTATSYEVPGIPEWGLGGNLPMPSFSSRMGCVLGKNIGPQHVIASIGLALARFSHNDFSIFAIIGNPGFDKNASYPAAKIIRAAFNNNTTIDQFLDDSGRKISYHSLVEEPVDADDVAIGVLWDIAQDVEQENSEYFPCLAPPFSLTIEVQGILGAEIRLSYFYDRRYFSDATVENMDLVLEKLCSSFALGVADNGSKRLSNIALMSEESVAGIARIGRSEILPTTSGVLRIEQKISFLALEQPNAKAITYEHKSLTYGELEKLSSRIAAVLRNVGVRQGDRVGICLDRSLELVPILLAVLKAGAAYVPLDPVHPLERIVSTLKDAQPSLVIGSHGTLSTKLDLPSLELDVLLELAAHVKAPDNASYDAVDTAYIIYTSGSTGRPKGVIVPHSNVASLVAATKDLFDLSASDVWTMFHSIAFDFSVWEIWGCLMTGGHLIVVPHWVSRSPDEFVHLLSCQNVTVLSQTPSAFLQMQAVESERLDRLPLRLIIFGGEPLDARLLLAWFDRYPETMCRIVNMFGITETTVHVTAETVRRTHALTNSRIVGCPIAGWHVYVMDAHQNLLPVGVPGEIYVGGAGVANGYLNRHDLSREKFVANPFEEGRLYRSGDRGRLLPDGRLEHLGRLDNQVKIRGFRIEIDEIRTVLLECSRVSAAVVVFRQAAAGDSTSARLDAYVVIKSGSVADVRHHASRLLPEYMMPTTITALDKIPLTINGKIDVTTLPTPTSDIANSGNLANVKTNSLSQTNNIRSDDSSIEYKLRSIWSSVLGCDVNIDDNFFALGGNSLYAIRIGAMMRDFGLPRVPVRELYARQTLRGVLIYLDANSTMN